jgi:hypothetical protein
LIVIYNVRGLIGLAGAIGVGLLAHAIGAPVPLAVAIGAVAPGAHDLHYRLKTTEELFTPSMGGMLYYIPIWLIASIAVVIGGYLQVVHRSPSPPPAYASPPPPVEPSPPVVAEAPPTHQSVPLFHVQIDGGVVMLGALTSSTALFEKPTIRILIVASTTTPALIAKALEPGPVDAIALCENEAWDDLEAKVEARKLSRKKADALEDELAGSRRFVIDDAAVATLAETHLIFAVSDAVCPDTLPQVLTCRPDGCGR